MFMTDYTHISDIWFLDRVLDLGFVFISISIESNINSLNHVTSPKEHELHST